jgi:hypothetical protein
MNLTANQEIGVLTEGDDQAPFVAQMFGPAYLGALLESAGFAKTMPMTSFVRRNIQQMDLSTTLTDKHKALLQDRDYTWRTIRTDRFHDDVEIVRQLLNDSMANNSLFVPMTPDEARFQLGPLEQVLDPALTRIAEYKGEPIAATLCTPDVNPLLRSMKSSLWPFGWLKFLLGRKRIRRASIIIILVKREHHGKGVIGVLNHDLFQALKAGGYTEAGGTWIGDSNKPSLKQAELVGMERLHRIHMYEKAL